MSLYEPTIGLEIHAELKTQTKMFCCSKNDPDALQPNVNVCPVCLAHPGTLPVINREAVRHVLRVGVALGATLADYTEFDRKNYFYPDLPKGYQLSQFEYPLVSGGMLHDVAVTRVHLEEDTASSVHTEDPSTSSTNSPQAGSGQGGVTTIDYNRAGVPLMELVTEPVIKSSKQAGDFARELQLLLRYLGVSEANMEKGEMRVEANISVAPAGQLGTKVEIKNLNSFRAMERAVEYEIQRQSALLEKGGTVVQETLGWDEVKQKTFSQRIKEGSADYRYFPDPDLPSLKLSEVPEFTRNTLQESLPELPSERRGRYISLGIKAEDAEAYIRDLELAKFVETVISGYEGNSERITLASNYIANDLISLMRQAAEKGKDSRDIEKRDTESQSVITISAEDFRKIIDMVAERRISSRAAKDVLAVCVLEGKDPQDVVREGNLMQNSSTGDLEDVVMGILENNPTVVADYKAGKSSALEYLLGQSMKALRGAADPVALRALISQKLS